MPREKLREILRAYFERNGQNQQNEPKLEELRDHGPTGIILSHFDSYSKTARIGK